MRVKDRFLEYIEEQTYIELTKEKNISSEELVNWCLELGLSKHKKSDSKLIIKERLLENGITYLDFYNRFKDRAYGIHPSRFSNKFRVNNYQRKKMIDTNFIKVAYYKDEEIFPGRIEKVPFFNPKWYFSINFNDIEIWRADNIKGYNNKQLRMDI